MSCVLGWNGVCIYTDILGIYMELFVGCNVTMLCYTILDIYNGWRINGLYQPSISEFACFICRNLGGNVQEYDDELIDHH